MEKPDIKQDKEDYILSLNILNDFSNQFYEKKEFDKCAVIDFKIFESSSKILGLENPDTLKAMFNLAVDYTKLEKYEQARETYEDLIELRKKVLGSKHPDTIEAMTNLISVYSSLKMTEKVDSVLDELKKLDTEEK